MIQFKIARNSLNLLFLKKAVANVFFLKVFLTRNSNDLKFVIYLTRKLCFLDKFIVLKDCGQLKLARNIPEL